MFQRMMLLFFRPASVYTLPGFRWDIFPPCAAPASIIGSDVLFCRHNRLRICSVFYRSLDQGGEESRSGRLYSRESQNLNYLEYSVCDLWPKVYPVQCHDQDSSNGSQGCLWIPSALDIASIDLNRPCRFFVIHVPSEIIVSPDNSVFQLMYSAARSYVSWIPLKDRKTFFFVLRVCLYMYQGKHQGQDLVNMFDRLYTFIDSNLAYYSL